MDFHSYGHHAPVSVGLDPVPNSVDTATFPRSFKTRVAADTGGTCLLRKVGQHATPPSSFSVGGHNDQLSPSLRQMFFAEDS